MRNEATTLRPAAKLADAIIATAVQHIPVGLRKLFWSTRRLPVDDEVCRLVRPLGEFFKEGVTGNRPHARFWKMLAHFASGPRLLCSRGRIWAAVFVR